MSKWPYGSCFKLAFEILLENPSAILVHAIITNPSGRKITHGWVEYTNGLGQTVVFDAVVKKTFSKQYFYDGYQPIAIVRYTILMAKEFAHESDTFGPWDYQLVKFMRDAHIPTRNESQASRRWQNALLRQKSGIS